MVQSVPSLADTQAQALALVREFAPHADAQWVACVATLVALDFVGAHDGDLPPTYPLQVWAESYVANICNLSCDLA